MVWSWHVAGTEKRCRLLWKLDDVGARIWAESHELELERIDGTDEVKTVATYGIPARLRPARPTGPVLAPPAQVRRFPRR